MATLDTRLPLIAAQAGQVNLADLYRQKQEMDLRGQQMQMNERRIEQQDRALDLQEREYLASLGAEEREAAKAGVKDMAAAVQWADTPEKWAQVQQHYAQFDPRLGQIPFERRESALLYLGQMGEYLENTKPDLRAIEPGGSLFSVGPQGVKELVRANPGNAAPASPVQNGPQPGQVEDGYRFKGGDPSNPNNWEPVGGAGSNASGTFQP